MNRKKSDSHSIFPISPSSFAFFVANFGVRAKSRAASPTMKRWAILTVALYALLLLLLTVPALILGAARMQTTATGGKEFILDLASRESLQVFQEWGYWLGFVVIVSAQALLLLVPVKAAERRPVARRHLLVPVITGAFLLANLLLAGMFAILAAVAGDKMDKAFETPLHASNLLLQSIPGLAPLLARNGLTPGDDFLFLAHLLGLLGIFWMIWALVFHSFAKSGDADTLSRRITQWLLRGSILELLVAVPCHIVTRQREDCCAPMASFWGIVTGLCVMLMSFGPGVFFLFARRIRQKQARRAPPVISLEP